MVRAEEQAVIDAARALWLYEGDDTYSPGSRSLPRQSLWTAVEALNASKDPRVEILANLLRKAAQDFDPEASDDSFVLEAEHNLRLLDDAKDSQ